MNTDELTREDNSSQQTNLDSHQSGRQQPGFLVNKGSYQARELDNPDRQSMQYTALEAKPFQQCPLLCTGDDNLGDTLEAEIGDDTKAGVTIQQGLFTTSQNGARAFQHRVSLRHHL